MVNARLPPRRAPGHFWMLLEGCEGLARFLQQTLPEEAIGQLDAGQGIRNQHGFVVFHSFGSTNHGFRDSIFFSYRLPFLDTSPSNVHPPGLAVASVWIRIGLKHIRPGRGV